MAVIDCLEDPDETLKLKTLELLVTMTKANNVQVRAPSLPSNMEVMVIMTCKRYTVWMGVFAK